MIVKCPICNSLTSFLIQEKDKFGQEYKYLNCHNCRFLFEQDLAQNPGMLNEKVSKLYGGDYFHQIDEGWQIRGDGFLKVIKKVIKIYGFLKRKKRLIVLDYGGGNGYLASKLAAAAEVFYYDAYEKPTFSGHYTILEKPQKADMMYAVELVEHLTDMKSWNFLKEVAPDIFIFTTCLTDNIADKELANWVYLNPDAGHTALYSAKSLYLLGKKYGFLYCFFPSISCHFFIKNKLLSQFNFVAFEYFIYSILRKIMKK